MVGAQLPTPVVVGVPESRGRLGSGFSLVSKRADVVPVNRVDRVDAVFTHALFTELVLGNYRSR